MEMGRIAVFVGLGASIAAIIAYIVSLRGSRAALIAGRVAYAVTGAATLVCFFRLMFLMAGHHFEYQYVFDYSSADLKFPWKYAATWAGQQGSFLLWAFWTAIIGGLLILKAGKWEARVMPFYTTVLTCLFGVLVLLNPFELIPRGTGASQYPLDLPWPPADGMGLNPSLQNYWMAIHPPTIFFGFASLAVPFSYALAAMVWKEYTTWVTRVMPYVLLTIATLGVGLFMGGYWAYETLGWHGFWAWDPVENASLFPWLGSLGLLHGLVVQKSRGGMGRTNIFLAIFAWMLFLYGTFLTRSGVLGSASVHAFSSLDNVALYLLIGLAVLHGVGGIGLLLVRWKQIPGRPISDKAASRDTAMVLSVTLFIIATVVVLIGSSWPFFSKLSFLSNIQYSGIKRNNGVASLLPLFYNQVGSFLIIPALLIMGSVPFLAWGKTNLDKFINKVLVPWFAALGVGCLITAFVIAQVQSGFRPDTPQPVVVIIGTLGAFAAISNIMLAWKVMRSKAVTMGGWLAHVGIGLLMIGSVLTNVYEKTEYHLLLENGGVAKTSYGYAIRFAGWTHGDLTKQIDASTNEEEIARLKFAVDKSWYEYAHGIQLEVINLPGKEGAAKAQEPKEGEHVHEDGQVHADDAHEPAPNNDPKVITDKGENGEEINWHIAQPDQALTATKDNSFVATLPVFKSRNLDMSKLRNPNEESMRYMRWPYIHKDWNRDFYVTVAADPKLLRASVTVRPGDTKVISMPGVVTTAYKVHYKDFYMTGGGGPGTEMGAVIDLIDPDGKKVEARPGLAITEVGMSPVRPQVPEMNSAVVIDGRIDPNTKEVKLDFEVPGAPPVWMVPIAVTDKPYINIVWLGVILMGIGSIIAMVRRSLEARKGLMLEAVEAQGIVEPDEAPSDPAQPAPVKGGKVRPAKAHSGKPAPGVSRKDAKAG
jgi:cytochrome c-type biogenesis protein CcmF